MKIELLHATNFRCFDEIEIDLDNPVTFLTGSMAVGKSTVLDALRYALAGFCRGVEPSGRGAEDLARWGTRPETCCIVAKTSAGEVGRRLGEGPRSKTGQEIAKLTGISGDAALVCLAWDAFIDMGEAEAKSLLLTSLGVEVSSDHVRAAVGEENFSHIPPMKWGGPESIAAAYKAVFAERAAVKKAARSEVASDPLSGYPDRIRAWTLAQAEDNLRKARALIGQLQEELERAVAQEAHARGSTQRAREELEERLKEAREDLRRADQALKAIDTAPGKASAVRKILKAATESEQQTLSQLGELNGRLAATKDRLENLEASHRMLTGAEARSKGECPTCSSRLTKTVYEKLVKATLDELMAVRCSIPTMEAERDTLIAANDAAAGKVRDIQAELDRAELAKEHRETVEAAATTAGEKVARLEALKAQLDSQPEQHSLPGGQDTDALRQRIANGQQLIRQLEGYIPARRSVAAASDAQRRGAAHLKALEALCELLSPKGKVVEQLLYPKVRPFFKHISAAMAGFGYQADLDLADGFSLTAGRDGGPQIPLRLLSDSERLRLGLAVQIAFARQSGLNLILTDEVSRLDYEGKRELVKVVDDALASGLHQVILAGTMTVPRGKLVEPKIDGWCFYELG